MPVFAELFAGMDMIQLVLSYSRLIPAIVAGIMLISVVRMAK